MQQHRKPCGAEQVYTKAFETLQILESNAGTVDYATGNVTFTNVTINAIATGTSIKIFGRSSLADIAGKLNDVVEIKPEDVKVTAVGVRE